MLEASSSDVREGREGDDGQSRLDVVLSSWCVSIASHVVLYFVMFLALRGCTTAGSVGPKSGDGAFREVGLFIKPDLARADADESQSTDPHEALMPDDGQPHPDPTIFGDDNSVTDLLSLPRETGLPLLGPGPAVSPRSPADANDLIKPSPRRGGSDEPSGLGETTFFDIAAKGSRFLYVLDRSGSMYDHNAIRVAKEELIASLSALEQTQQFQVIFYNQDFVELRQNDERPGMQWATDINRTLARQFISGIQPDGGTDHVPALKKALRYQPEHLFLLTDADQPQLSARDLHEIKTLNGGRTRIHCVEFGKGSELAADNFLKKIARDNGGTYRYRDVTRFDRRLRQ